ncbi:hypothetical protein AYI69_g9247 [Smittium culicis]|uniref:Uncharacterized protein n=1 Tax=Smittium culicis TaxID=133412 RepID=A0A1R1XDY7_9FUNG|nr:hypothetical protein AYI69_g9247 [Smittium culicis]
MGDMAKSSLKFSILEPTKVDISTPPALLIKNDAPKTSIENKFMFAKPVEDPNQSPVTTRGGTVGLKKSRASSLIADEIPSSPIEKESSGDDTESDGSTDDNNKPLIKRTAKFTINSEDFSNISMDSDMSSPMEIKKRVHTPQIPVKRTILMGIAPPPHQRMK